MSSSSSPSSAATPRFCFPATTDLGLYLLAAVTEMGLKTQMTDPVSFHDVCYLMILILREFDLLSIAVGGWVTDGWGKTDLSREEFWESVLPQDTCLFRSGYYG